MSYIFKPPRPIEDYYIGKYHKGDCVYLITKEAYTNWKNQQITVKHQVCLTEGLTEYSLKAEAGYTAHRYHNIPKEWMEIINRDCLYLVPVFQRQEPIRSEPTPDQYYILKHKTEGYFAVLREVWDRDKAQASPNQAFQWVNNKPSGLSSPENSHFWPLNKKFPQLSSDAKAELQKQNPVKYREWEQFYMKKYPSFKPLREQDALKPKGKTIHELLDLKPLCGCGICKNCLGHIPLPDPKDDYIAVSADSTVAFMRRSLFKPGETIVYDANYGWKISAVKNYYDRQEDVIGLIRDLKMCRGVMAIAKEFEQYYAAQAQTPAWVQPKEYNKENIQVLSTIVSHLPDNWGYIKSGWNFVDKTYYNSLRDGDLFIGAMWEEPTKFTKPLKKGQVSLQEIPARKYNPKLYDRVMSLKGSDFDIDEKAMKADYQDTLRKIDQDRINQKIGKVMIFGTGTGEVKSNEALKAMFYNPSSYTIGYDPYQKENGSKGVTTIFNKNRRTGQSWVNKTMKELEEKYAKRIVDLYWDQPKSDLSAAMGMALYAQNQQQYSPTLKQQKNETIIVCRKVKPIIRQQIIRGTATQGNRIEPAITRGHLSYQPSAITGQKSIGNSKICLSVKRPGNC